MNRQIFPTRESEIFMERETKARAVEEALTDERSHGGRSEEAVQQERSLDGGVTSGSETHDSLR